MLVLNVEFYQDQVSKKRDCSASSGYSIKFAVHVSTSRAPTSNVAADSSEVRAPLLPHSCCQLPFLPCACPRSSRHWLFLTSHLGDSLPRSPHRSPYGSRPPPFLSFLALRVSRPATISPVCVRTTRVSARHTPHPPTSQAPAHATTQAILRLRLTRGCSVM